MLFGEVRELTIELRINELTITPRVRNNDSVCTERVIQPALVDRMVSDELGKHQRSGGQKERRRHDVDRHCQKHRRRQKRGHPASGGLPRKRPSRSVSRVAWQDRVPRGIKQKDKDVARSMSTLNFALELQSFTTTVSRMELRDR